MIETCAVDRAATGDEAGNVAALLMGPDGSLTAVYRFDDLGPQSDRSRWHRVWGQSDRGWEVDLIFLYGLPPKRHNELIVLVGPRGEACRRISGI